MKKIAVMVIVALGVSQMASAMPCDSGYSCKSKSGKYEIEVGRCRRVNALHGLQVRIGGTKIEEVELSAAYDSKSLGGKVLAFTTELPDAVNDLRILTVEIIGQSGTVSEEVFESNPGSGKIVSSESISCIQEE